MSIWRIYITAAGLWWAQGRLPTHYGDIPWKIGPFPTFDQALEYVRDSKL